MSSRFIEGQRKKLGMRQQWWWWSAAGGKGGLGVCVSFCVLHATSRHGVSGPRSLSLGSGGGGATILCLVWCINRARAFPVPPRPFTSVSGFGRLPLIFCRSMLFIAVSSSHYLPACVPAYAPPPLMRAFGLSLSPRTRRNQRRRQRQRGGNPKKAAKQTRKT